MKKTAAALALILVASSFAPVNTLRGTWQYVGGIYNGQHEGATKGYNLQRKYTDATFDAFVIEKGHQSEKYQSGYYILKNDSCVETETFSSQPSKLTGIPVHYRYVVRHDSLILMGKLPTGMVVEEYWKKGK
jgi:hypothetical protein